MSKAIKTTLGLVVSLFLLSTLTTAETSPSISNKTGNKKEDTAHHSRLAKAAFWRHHDAKAKPAAAASTKAKSQKPQTKPAQLKPVSAKVAAGKNDQKPQKNSNSNSNSNDISKSAAKKAPVASKSPAANKTKSQPKTQTHETVSLQ